LVYNVSSILIFSKWYTVAIWIRRSA
jgi:hypothetical protein